MSRAAKHLDWMVVVVLFLFAFSLSARADFIVDDFSAPDPRIVPVVILLDPDPTLVETPDPGIGGGERDILVDVLGTPTPSSFIGEIGNGSFLFGSSSPGTTATIQYDGVDVDILGPPAQLVNSEGLGGVDLTFGNTLFGVGLDFLSLDGVPLQTTSVEIEVHSSTSTSTFVGAIPDAAGLARFYAPFSAFSGSAMCKRFIISFSVFRKVLHINRPYRKHHQLHH